MRNKIKLLVMNIIVKLCIKMALSVSASACYFGMYQPKEPECLRRD